MIFIFTLASCLLISISAQPGPPEYTQRTDLTDFENLKKTLLTTLGYQNVRPGTHEAPTKVTLMFYLYKLNGIDGKEQIVHMTGQLHMEWTDERLQWNPADYGGATLLMLKNTDIWIPPVGLRNSAGLFIDSDARDVNPVYVHNSGEVMFDQLLKFHSTCELEMEWFPFDTQTCALKLGTLSQFSPPSINITEGWDNIDTTYLQESKEWSIVDAWGEIKPIQEYGSEAGWKKSVVPELQIWFSAQRNPTYYSLNIIVPVLCLAFLSMMAFLVPFGNGEKLGMSMTILLAFAVFMLILADHTPPAAKNPPVIAIYLSLVVGIVTINIISEIWILTFYHRYPVTPMPRWLQGMTDCLGRCYCFGKLNRLKKKSPKKMMRDVERRPDERYQRDDDRRDRYYEDNRRDRYHHNNGYRRDDGYDHREKRSRRYEEEHVHQKTVIRDDKIEKDTQSEEEVWQEEWKQLAQVLDRFLFGLFAIVNFIVVVALFFIMFPLKLRFSTSQGDGHTNPFDNIDYDQSPDYNENWS